MHGENGIFAVRSLAELHVLEVIVDNHSPLRGQSDSAAVYLIFYGKTVGSACEQSLVFLADLILGNVENAVGRGDGDVSRACGNGRCRYNCLDHRHFAYANAYTFKRKGDLLSFSGGNRAFKGHKRGVTENDRAVFKGDRGPFDKRSARRHGVLYPDKGVFGVSAGDDVAV